MPQTCSNGARSGDHGGQVDKNKAATEASYRVSQIIAQKKKPYEDGEMIKQAFLEAADSLFANFRNKDEIVSAIKSMQVSANTAMRRVEVMSNDIFLQLRTDLDNCVYFSLQLDESTDVVDTAQMAVFVRMVFSDFTIKEDLLKFIPLKGHTTGQDLFSHLKNIISSEKIPTSKMVGLTTDGSPAM
uniref:Zinc finger BED domain-containing protein 5-like n=1 Tax=Diabrotica virgifera virgifera TaxID=50390 RepID=A0A6P7GEG1_DIAVI